MKPYYEEKGITIYHGDCRDILPQLEPVDLVLTDPPYGIGMDGGNVGYKGFNNFEKLGWDKNPIDMDRLNSSISKGKKAIVFGGNYFKLPPSRCWFIWDKGEGFKARTYAEAELAWTNFDDNTKIFKYDPLANGDYHGKYHPTMKPLSLITWCIQQCKYWDIAQTILDPFMGSGTTLRAAKDLGRKAIGIEIEEKYCEIVAKRLQQEVFDFNDPK